MKKTNKANFKKIVGGVLAAVMAAAMFFSTVVLPAFGGLTIRPRWPLPMGLTRSMTRAVTVFLPCSIWKHSSG